MGELADVHLAERPAFEDPHRIRQCTCSHVWERGCSSPVSGGELRVSLPLCAPTAPSCSTTATDGSDARARLWSEPGILVSGSRSFRSTTPGPTVSSGTWRTSGAMAACTSSRRMGASTAQATRSPRPQRTWTAPAGWRRSTGAARPPAGPSPGATSSCPSGAAGSPASSGTGRRSYGRRKSHEHQLTPSTSCPRHSGITEAVLGQPGKEMTLLISARDACEPSGPTRYGLRFRICAQRNTRRSSSCAPVALG